MVPYRLDRVTLDEPVGVVDRDRPRSTSRPRNEVRRMYGDLHPRVAQLVLTLCPGGAERLAIELSRRLAGRFGMTVICLEEAGALAELLNASGIDVIAIRRRQGFRPSLARTIAELTRAHGIDVLHCQQYSPYVYGSLARLLRPSLRVIYTEHGRLGDGPPSLKRKAINPLLAPLPHAIYAVSNELRRHMLAEGFPASRVGVITNGIDVGERPGEIERKRARAELLIPPDALVFGTAARLDPVKGLGTLIDAFAKVRSEVSGARLLIVGDGPERDELVGRAAAHDLGDAVLFAGYRVNARGLLPACDVYVNSSVSEGLSLTILEAMAAELPVVATAVGGTPEVVSDGENGLLVLARDPDSLSRAMLTLARDERQRLRLAANGRAIVEARFTLDRMIDDYARAYCQAHGLRLRAHAGSRR
jgi:glycosyltransferase involved in cell wall biosynthesis